MGNVYITFRHFSNTSFISSTEREVLIITLQEVGPWGKEGTCPPLDFEKWEAKPFACQIWILSPPSFVLSWSLTPPPPPTHTLSRPLPMFAPHFPTFQSIYKACTLTFMSPRKLCPCFPLRSILLYWSYR